MYKGSVVSRRKSWREDTVLVLPRITELNMISCTIQDAAVAKELTESESLIVGSPMIILINASNKLGKLSYFSSSSDLVVLVETSLS